MPYGYKDRLVALDLLPLSYDREVKDIVFFFKAYYGYTKLDVNQFVSFVGHGRTRSSQIQNVLRVPFCKTSTFQSSYFNRIVKLWNNVCKLVDPATFVSPASFSHFLKQNYSCLLLDVYDCALFCTWSMTRDCPCHRS